MPPPKWAGVGTAWLFLLVWSSVLSWAHENNQTWWGGGSKEPWDLCGVGALSVWGFVESSHASLDVCRICCSSLLTIPVFPEFGFIQIILFILIILCFCVHRLWGCPGKRQWVSCFVWLSEVSVFLQKRAWALWCCSSWIKRCFITLPQSHLLCRPG